MPSGWRIESRLPSDEVVDAFLRLIRAGNLLKVACAMTGMSDRTIQQWVQEADRGEDPRPWVQRFVRSFKEAKAYAQAAHLQNIVRAAQAGQWQASAWFLERTSPQEWGRRVRHDLLVDESMSEPQHDDPREALALQLDQLAAEMAAQDAEEALNPLLPLSEPQAAAGY